MYSVKDLKTELNAFFSDNKWIKVKHGTGRTLEVVYPRRGEACFRLYHDQVQVTTVKHDNSSKIRYRSYYGRGLPDNNTLEIRNYALDQIHCALLDVDEFFNGITPYMFKEYRWNDVTEGPAQVEPMFASNQWRKSGRLDTGYILDQEYILKHDGDPSRSPLFVLDMKINRLQTTIAFNREIYYPVRWTNTAKGNAGDRFRDMRVCPYFMGHAQQKPSVRREFKMTSGDKEVLMKALPKYFELERELQSKD